MKKKNKIKIALSISFIALIFLYYMCLILSSVFIQFRCKANEPEAKETLQMIFASQMQYALINGTFAKNFKELKEESDVEIDGQDYDLDMYTFDQGQSFEVFLYGKTCGIGTKIVHFENGSKVNGIVFTR